MNSAGRMQTNEVARLLSLLPSTTPAQTDVLPRICAALFTSVGAALVNSAV